MVIILVKGWLLKISLFECYVFVKFILCVIGWGMVLGWVLIFMFWDSMMGFVGFVIGVMWMLCFVIRMLIFLLCRLMENCVFKVVMCILFV